MITTYRCGNGSGWSVEVQVAYHPIYTAVFVIARSPGGGVEWNEGTADRNAVFRFWPRARYIAYAVRRCLRAISDRCPAALPDWEDFAKAYSEKYFAAQDGRDSYVSVENKQ